MWNQYEEAVCVKLNFRCQLCSERSGLSLTNSFKLRFIAERASCKRSTYTPARACSNIQSNRTHASKHLSALTVAETCSQPLNSWQNSSARDAHLHGVPMPRSHAPRAGRTWSPTWLPGFRADGGEVRTLNWFSLFRGAPLLTSYQYHPKSKTSNGILQLVPEATGKATSSSNVCVSLETINCSSMECTLQPRHFRNG